MFSPRVPWNEDNGVTNSLWQRDNPYFIQVLIEKPELYEDYFWPTTSSYNESGLSDKTISRLAFARLQSAMFEFADKAKKTAGKEREKYLLLYVTTAIERNRMAINFRSGNSNIDDIEKFCREENFERGKELLTEYRMKIHHIRTSEAWFYCMSQESKYQYFTRTQPSTQELSSLAFRSDLDSFTALSVKRAFEKPYLLELLYNYQMEYKGALLRSELRMKTLAKHPNESFRKLYAEWEKARANGFQNGGSSKLNRYDHLTRQLYAISESGKTLEEINKLEERDIYELFEYKPLVTINRTSHSWTEIQKLLQADEASVEIIRYTDRERIGSVDSIQYIALVLTQEAAKPILVQLGNGALENRNVAFYRNSIKAQLPDSISYSAFWKRLATHPALSRTKRIYLCNDGVYHSINVGSLYDTNQKKYVQEMTDVVLVGNTSDLLSGVRDSSGIKNATLFGFPSYKRRTRVSTKTAKPASDSNRIIRAFNREAVPPLPGTLEEVQSIQNILQSARVPAQLFTGPLATENDVRKLKQPNVLHIATHGYFLENPSSSLNANPLFASGLLFAGAEESMKDANAGQSDANDGILNAYEVTSMQLDSTELVVLSACETALGKFTGNEGIFGLQRAFILAGAKTLVMTLWQVDDTATKDFMVAFYTELAKTRNQKASFRHAQNWLKEKYPHPYYWGAFVMINTLK